LRSRSAIALAGTTMLITKCSVQITNCVAANPAEPLASYQINRQLSARIPPPLVIHASQDLGAGFWRTFWSIVLPLIMPGIVAGFLFVFVVAVGTVLLSVQHQGYCEIWSESANLPEANRSAASRAVDFTSPH
jgi:ABC-type Fe3+ transport system permease subunit